MTHNDKSFKKKLEKEKSRSILMLGSQHSRSEHTGEDISFRQHLPPIELREEEYILSALMANSRYEHALNMLCFIFSQTDPNVFSEHG